MHTDSVWHLVSALSCMFFSLSPFYQTEESSVTCSQREAAHALSQWPVNSLLTEARPPLCEPQPEPIHRRKVSTVHWLFTHIYLTIKVLKLIKSFWLLITPTLKKKNFFKSAKKKNLKPQRLWISLNKLRPPVVFFKHHVFPSSNDFRATALGSLQTLLTCWRHERAAKILLMQQSQCQMSNQCYHISALLSSTGNWKETALFTYSLFSFLNHNL